jgi:hypothetical protein
MAFQRKRAGKFRNQFGGGKFLKFELVAAGVRLTA